MVKRLLENQFQTTPDQSLYTTFLIRNHSKVPNLDIYIETHLQN